GLPRGAIVAHLSGTHRGGARHSDWRCRGVLRRTQSGCGVVAGSTELGARVLLPAPGSPLHTHSFFCFLTSYVRLGGMSVMARPMIRPMPTMAHSQLRPLSAGP